MKIIFPLLLLLGALLLAPHVRGQQTAAPRRLDLSGRWDFRFDPDARGEAAGWPQEESTEDWKKIRVPGSYNEIFPEKRSYQGKAWYRTTFTVPARWPRERLILRFLGVALRSKIWLNGRFVGEHLFPYTSFEFDVTDAARRGGETNTLVVLVDNEILARAIPDTRWNGWWNDGGINREVYLESRPEVATERIAVTTRMAEGGAWDLDLRLTTENRTLSAAAEGLLVVDVLDAVGRNLWHAEFKRPFPLGRAENTFATRLADIRPWSPDAPRLYTLRVRTLINGRPRHEKRLAFGFRQIEARGTRIFLNGKPLLIKGISRHEFYPGAGMTVPPARTRQDLAEIKALGCNMVRLAHYSQHPLVYELCDRLGLLVWDELPAWKTRAETLGDAEVWRTYGAPQLAEMIENKQHHPSVIIWSVGNEFPSERAEAAEYVARAVRHVRELDPTRLVTFASDRRERDVSFAPVDLIGINEYYGWYYGTIHDIGPNLDLLHQKWPNKPILVTEVGAGAVRGWRNSHPLDEGMDHSEDYQIKFLSTHLAQIFAPARREFVTGALLWLYNDFPDPHRLGGKHPAVDNYINNKGLVTPGRRRKRAFAVVQRIFRAVGTGRGVDAGRRLR